MRVFGYAWKINFSEGIWSWPCKMRLWPWKWFEVKIFTSNHFRVRRAKREREREKSLRRRRTQSLDRTPPQTRRWDRAVEFAPPRSSAPLFSFSFSTQSWSAPSLPILFLLLIGAVVTDLVLILDAKLIGAADLVVSILSHQWSRCLDLVVVSLFLKFSISLSSSLSLFDQICMKSVEVLSKFLFL